METKTYNFVDKSTWGTGPWQHEPDKLQYPDPETGLPCLAVRHPSLGHWCGYVGVPDGHPAHGGDYDSLKIDVHGGLTFAGFCGHDPDEHGICHIPGEGESDTVYWLGYDCAHAGDSSPARDDILRTFKSIYVPRMGEYRDLEYIKSENASLARQLLALVSP